MCLNALTMGSLEYSPGPPGGNWENSVPFGNGKTQYWQESTKSCYNLVSASVAGINHLSVGHGQSESTPLNILVNHWREVRKRGKKLVSSSKEGQVSHSLLL